MGNIEKALIGNPSRIAKSVIISPVFYPQSWGLKAKRTACGNLISLQENFTFIKTYPAPNWVFDTVCALAGTKAKMIVFVGTGGGIGSKLKIGEVVAAQSACWGNWKRMFRPAKSLLALVKIPQAKVFSLNSFLEETKANLLRLKKRGVDLIDLETASFYRASRKIKIKGIALLVVEDLPFKSPFYFSLSKTKKVKLTKGIESLKKLCLSLVQNP